MPERGDTTDSNSFSIGRCFVRYPDKSENTLDFGFIMMYNVDTIQLPHSNERGIYHMKISDESEFRQHINRVIIPEEDIKKAVAEAGKMLSEKYNGKPLLLVSILKGAFIFLGDLSRAVTIPCEIGFMAAKSYFDSTESSGNVKITLDIAQDISKYNVVIVEDIIDTGKTLHEVMKYLKAKSPLSLMVLTLLDKPERRQVDLEADYSLFTIPDYFVIGYGLDYGEYYRNLPYIAEFKE